jgi:iron complex outermembrane receptor protein
MTKQYIAVLISLLVLISGNIVFAQTQFVSGKVIDAATGKVIPGVNVFESNFNGATTNSSGKFKIELDTGLTQLKFSFIGYQFKSVKLKVDEENDDLLVRLIPKDFDLKTVVVSASKRSQDIYEVPVSIEILPAKLIETKNTANIEDALQQVPSVNILDGQANIRGGSGFSYGAGSRVLVLVDDMPMLSGDASDVKWNYLPVENINQIEVLKGASSALYGSAALNGIINIRTKQPTETPQSDINFYSGVYSSFGDTD